MAKRWKQLKCPEMDNEGIPTMEYCNNYVRCQLGYWKYRGGTLCKMHDCLATQLYVQTNAK